MSSLLLVGFASHWAGKAVPCQFQAWGDGNPLPLSGVSTAAAPVFQIASSTAEVKLTVTPTDKTYSENTVFLLVGSNGLTAKPGSEGFLVLSKSTTLGDPPVTFAKVVLSRFKDVTAATIALLSSPPASRHVLVDAKTNTWTDTAQGWDTHTKTWIALNAAELQDHKDTWGTWPPSDWGLHDLTAAHFIDTTNPVHAGGLNFVKSAVAPNVDSVVLQLSGVVAPQLFGVTWPNDIKPKVGATPTPTPFLIFIEQSLKGNGYDEGGQFVGGPLAPYPNNSDYADMLFQQLHYAGTPSKPATPFFWEGAKGVPYQVAKAGVNVVTVVPVNSFEKEYGVMDDTEQIGMILAELQAFMFMRAGVATLPTSVGKTALASFSSGNYILNKWLSSPANVSGDFLTKTVNAVYFLDPILWPDHPPDVNDYVKSAQDWATATGADKRIRLYMRLSTAAHQQLMGKTPPASPFVSSGKLRTAAWIPQNYWTAAALKFGKRTIDPSDGFSFSHHMFAATMLTHALSQNDLT